MHADTIQLHNLYTHDALELCTAWAGTKPMTSEAQVREAILRADIPEEELDMLLPYVIDACRERGLLVGA